MSFRPPPGLWGTRSVKHYEKVEQIGEGTYGQVYKARNRVTGSVVALKKIRVHSENYGLPVTAIREIKILNEISHPNMVRLLEIVTSIGQYDDDDERGAPRTDRRRRGSLYIVLEYLEHDLAGLLDLSIAFSPVQVKGLLRQLLDVLAYVHVNKYVHRDIKCSNLLIDNQLRLKLADFGLARRLNEVPTDLTNRVITLWYRPPELLLGATRYGPSVDCWGVGCILAELVIGKPLFPAKVEAEQLDLVFQVCGTPDPRSWPGCDELPAYESIMPKKTYKGKLREHLMETSRKVGTDKLLTVEAVDLIERLLTLDPQRRASAKKALSARYFRTQPVCPEVITDLGPLDLPDRGGSYHEFQTKRKRKEDGQIAQEAKRAQRRKEKRAMQGLGDAATPTRESRMTVEGMTLRSSPGKSGVGNVTKAALSNATQSSSAYPVKIPSAHQQDGMATKDNNDATSTADTSRNWAPPPLPPSLLSMPPPPQPTRPPPPVYPAAHTQSAAYSTGQYPVAENTFAAQAQDHYNHPAQQLHPPPCSLATPGWPPTAGNSTRRTNR